MNDTDAVLRLLKELVQVHQRGWIDYANLIIMAVTAAVVLWYTIETSRLRRTAEAQITEMQTAARTAQTPILIVSAFDEGDRTGDPILKLQNVGQCAAVNIEADICSPQKDELGLWYPDALPAQGKDLVAVYEISSREATDWCWTHGELIGAFEQGVACTPMKLRFNYQNVGGENFESEALITYDSESHLCAYTFVGCRRLDPNPSNEHGAPGRARRAMTCRA